jgi:hypothetical protein
MKEEIWKINRLAHPWIIQGWATYVDWNKNYFVIVSGK